jgi:hypothetical protein
MRLLTRPSSPPVYGRSHRATTTRFAARSLTASKSRPMFAWTPGKWGRVRDVSRETCVPVFESETWRELRREYAAMFVSGHQSGTGDRFGSSQVIYFEIKERRAIRGGGSLLNARLFNQLSSLTAGHPVAGRRLQPNCFGFRSHIIRRRHRELYSPCYSSFGVISTPSFPPPSDGYHSVSVPGAENAW